LKACVACSSAETSTAIVVIVVSRTSERFAGAAPLGAPRARARGRARWHTDELQGRRPRGGKPWAGGVVYKVLANRVYLGEAVHKGVA
jgi:hypothetical protein